MKKNIKVAVVVVIIIAAIIITHYKFRDTETKINDADQKVISDLIKDELGEDILSSGVSIEGKDISNKSWDGDDTGYFVKMELRDEKVNEVISKLAEKFKADEFEEVVGHFGLYYVYEINSGNIRFYDIHMTAGPHQETQVKETWIVENDGKTFLYYSD